MTQKEIEFVKEQFSSKADSPLRQLFYTNRGLPRQKLYTKEQILDKLNIPEPDNIFEKEGIYHRLHVGLSLLRKEAKEHGLSFVDFRIEREEGRDIYYHGYINDVDKIKQTIELYNERVDIMQNVLRLTKEVADSNIITIKEQSKNKEIVYNPAGV